MTAEEYLYKGSDAYGKGDFKLAIESYSKAIGIKPDYAEAYIFRGRAKRSLSDYRGAIADYDKAIEIKPDEAEAYFFRGYIKFNLSDYHGAIADYDKAIDIKPDYADVYIFRGSAKANLPDYHGAIADYDKAIGIKPDYAEAYIFRGNAKSDLSDYQGAIVDYDKGIEFKPDDAEAYNNRGIAKSNLSDYKGAIADYNKAIAINPDDAVAYNNRGIAKYNLSDYRGAISDYDKAIELKPDYAKAYYLLGNVKYFNLSDYHGAISDYNKAIEIKPDGDILYILVTSSKDERKKIIETNALFPFLDLDANDGQFFKETTKGIDKKDLDKYKEAYIRSIDIISLLHINNANERLLAYYTKKSVARMMLIDGSSFRLNSINYSNDFSEGKTLLDYLEKSITKTLETDYRAFAGCFTFNHDSLNQFRLYGKEDEKEGTGLSLVFKNSFFSKEAKMPLRQMAGEDITLKEEEKEEKKKHALFRCIYIDPDPKASRVETVGHKESYLFHREDKDNQGEIEKYEEYIKEIVESVREKMEELKKLVKDLDTDTVAKLLINLRYLTKHIAFKEEQECRILKIHNLKEEILTTSEDFKQMYVEYPPIVRNHIEKIYFGTKANGMDLFQDMLIHKGLKVTCEKSINPLA